MPDVLPITIKIYSNTIDSVRLLISQSAKLNNRDLPLIRDGKSLVSWIQRHRRHRVQVTNDAGTLFAGFEVRPFTNHLA
jgi:hypothetical protein